MKKKDDYTEELRGILKKGVGVATVREVAARAAKDKILYDTLVDLIQDNNMHTRMKASWALSKATELNHEFAAGHFALLFKQATKEQTQGVVREILKTLAVCKIPDSFEGEYINLCFALLEKVETDLAAKYHAKNALVKFVKKYPELKNELIDALYRVLNSHTLPWKAHVMKTILKLEK